MSPSASSRLTAGAAAAGGAPGAQPRPWYREIWPWLLMLPPALSVAGGAAMVYLATHTSSALVVDDYARIEALTSERFERDREAARLGIGAELTFARAPSRIELSLAAPAPFTLPRTLELALQHATNPAADRKIELVRAGDRYTAAADLAPGHYRIELVPEDGAWRLGGELPGSDVRISLRPQAAPARVSAPEPGD